MSSVMNAIVPGFSYMWDLAWSVGGSLIALLSSWVVQFLYWLVDPVQFITLAAWYFRTMDSILTVFMPTAAMDFIHAIGAFWSTPDQPGYNAIICAVWALDLICVPSVVMSTFAALWSVACMSILIRIGAYVAAIAWTNTN